MNLREVRTGVLEMTNVGRGWNSVAGENSSNASQLQKRQLNNAKPLLFQITSIGTAAETSWIPSAQPITWRTSEALPTCAPGGEFGTAPQGELYRAGSPGVTCLLAHHEN
jgi:hypothetical protein